jgi:drug/metabolite transporter (DMT)-like permease
MALGLIGVAIFGATLPVTKLALADFSPGFITFGRATVASVAAAAALLALRRPFPARKMGGIFTAGFLMIYAFPGLMALAMETVPAVHGGIVLGVLPLATAAFAALIADERPSPAFWYWGAIGAALVFAFTFHEAELRLAAGDLWLLASGLCAALGYVIFGKLSRGMPGWEAISWALVVTLPFSIIGSVVTWESQFVIARPASVAAFLYLAFFSMFLGFFAWNAALAMGGIARVSQVQLMQSFVTIAVAAVLLGEPVTPLTMAFALAVATVVWIGRRARIDTRRVEIVPPDPPGAPR